MAKGKPIITLTNLPKKGTGVAAPQNKATPARAAQNESAPPIWLTPSELAGRWRMVPRTLDRWRADHRGPAFHHIGGRVLYLLSDVLGYEGRHRRKGG